MTEPPKHVHIVDDVPELTSSGGAGPVLVVALDGFLDAGNGGRLAVDHLLAGPADGQGGKVVASFEIDAFYDYRARRPPMSFVEDHYEGYVAPRLVARLQHDATGTPYLLLSGPEPDTHWEAFAAAVRAVVEHFGVRLTVFLGAVPMAVPHTRAVMVTNHATSPELLMTRNIWRGVIRIPASAMSMLEQRLGEWGHDATGFVAHVPHYVAQGDYPAAAVKLVECVEIVTGLQWQLEALQDAAAVRAAEIAQQIAETPDVREVVAGLEQQYDAFARADEDGGALPLAEEQELPTAEELGAEFERFLAAQAESDDD